MKWLYLFLIALLSYSCSELDPNESTVYANSNMAKKAITDSNITISDLTGIWVGLDQNGKKFFFLVDKGKYSLAAIEEKDLGPIAPPPRRNEFPNQNTNSNIYHFNSNARDAYKLLVSGNIDEIRFNGSTFYSQKEQTETEFYDLTGTYSKDNDGLRLTLFSGTNSASSSTEHLIEDILFIHEYDMAVPDRSKREVTDPPNTVYRRDTRDPSVIFTNGFQPRGQNSDLIAHITGASLYQQGVPLSGWISTSASLTWTTNPSQPMPNNEFWVYTIAPTSGAYSVIRSLQHHIDNTINVSEREFTTRLIHLYGGQNEWAFLGPISSSNIRRATRYRFENSTYQSVETRENPSYNRSVIPSGNPDPYQIFSTLPGFHNQFFRADIRTPDQIIAARGIIQDGITTYTYLNWATNVAEMNLYRHSRSSYRDSYGYVSINNNLRVSIAQGPLEFPNRNRYYIYVIAQAPNIFYTSSILGRFMNRQNHFSAMGGIPITQIVGWYTVTNGHLIAEMTPNPYHVASAFSGLSVTNGTAGYPYAGFPLGHAAWLENPWRNFAPEYCERSDRYPDLKRDAALSWCEYNTNVKSKKLFSNFKTRFYTSVQGHR